VTDRRHDIERLSDQQINHVRRFAGLPPLDAKEMKSWRGLVAWMRGRFRRRLRSHSKER
jgi:hypothetical protein